jgi:ParB-like chromosome segregation protein Spo0J
MSKSGNFRHADIPIVKLTPVRTRKVPPKAYAKLLANIKAVGLIEPLCVYKEGDQYLIVDGYVRYQALMEMGVELVPCLILPTKDLYTLNRQVNNLSARDEIKMLRTAMEKLDEKTLAEAFGLKSLRTRLNTGIYRGLHPDALRALETGKIYQSTARELTYVQPERQAVIVQMMKTTGDWSLAFAKAQILKTPPNMRSRKRKLQTPWDKSADKKRALVKKLEEVEKHFDFYSGLYRQYVGDLLKLAAHVRQILGRPKLRTHLRDKHPDTLRLFESVIEESEGKAASEA